MDWVRAQRRGGRIEIYFDQVAIGSRIRRFEEKKEERLVKLENFNLFFGKPDRVQFLSLEKFSKFHETDQSEQPEQSS